MSNVEQLLVATHNSAKLSEMKELLGEVPYDVVFLDDIGITFDVEETGTSFEENALLKAKTYCELSGLLTLADDSGLEVSALHGEPGIHSNRYAGPYASEEEKVQFLLQKMAHVPREQRQAQFTVYMVLVWPSGKTKGFTYHYTGSIAFEPRGQWIRKFPYRVIFIPTNFDKTLAELIEQGIAIETPRTKCIAMVKDYLLAQ